MSSERSRGRAVAGSVGCAAFAVAAVLVEALAGAAADSPERGWATRLVPLAWPQPARVIWWLIVATAAAGHRLLLDRAGDRPPRWWIAAAVAAPFVVFAGGIAAGAQWSTWH